MWYPFLFLIIFACFHTRNAKMIADNTTGYSSYFGGGQIALFDESVSYQSKEDALYSLLLAQLNASAIAQRDSVDKWYQAYESALVPVDWIQTEPSKGFYKFIPQRQTISLRTVIEETLIPIISLEFDLNILVTMHLLYVFGYEYPKVQNFTDNVYFNNTYNMQFQLVSEKNGLLTLFQLYIVLKTQESSGRNVFVLHNYQTNAVDIQLANQTSTLNISNYANIRDNVKNQIGRRHILDDISYINDNGPPVPL